MLALLCIRYASALENASTDKASDSTTISSKAERCVVCVGDSNTAGPYPDLLEKALGEGWTTVNRGKGAATVIEGKLNPHQKLPEYEKSLVSKPDVVIMLGTNDANPRWWDDPERITSFEGSPAQEFSARYLSLRNSYQSLATKPQIILTTPLPIFPDRATRKKMRAERIARQNNLLNHNIPLIRNTAEELDLPPVVYVQKLIAGQEEHCKDGVHYTDPGYQALGEILKVEVLANQAAVGNR